MLNVINELIKALKIKLMIHLFETTNETSRMKTSIEIQNKNKTGTGSVILFRM